MSVLRDHYPEPFDFDGMRILAMKVRSHQCRSEPRSRPRNDHVDPKFAWMYCEHCYPRRRARVRGVHGKCMWCWMEAVQEAQENYCGDCDEQMVDPTFAWWSVNQIAPDLVTLVCRGCWLERRRINEVFYLRHKQTKDVIRRACRQADKRQLWMPTPFESQGVLLYDVRILPDNLRTKAYRPDRWRKIVDDRIERSTGTRPLER